MTGKFRKQHDDQWFELSHLHGHQQLNLSTSSSASSPDKKKLKSSDNENEDEEDEEEEEKGENMDNRPLQSQDILQRMRRKRRRGQ